ncbi:hypothetical protein EAH89_13415 [Roseomonas nepalensis]|uniref:Uncharacterized protein n=1 Tax=Muricoccus nepalensis TaxID=1854500 RepID=A0A502G2Z8_9PROT|nr:hypothetical protein [Roseomonas nepalensis]TPG55931.1 hypothetical protein EAH89_13415 [Roseomonas nepalensis]
MDGMTVSPGTALVVRGEEARQRLEEALQGLTAALEEFNILPGHPEAKFVATMAGAQRSFGNMAVAFGEDLRGVVAAAQGLNEAQMQRLEVMIALADSTIRQTQAAGVAAEAEAEKALTKVIEYIGPEISNVLRDTVVVKELTHNKRLLRREYLKTLAIAGLIFSAGYSVHLWQSWDATSAIERCRQSMEVNAAGRGYCAADRMFAAPVTAAQPSPPPR